ncbi:MAG: 2-amino-4-hydroxy-6-hydroxymethyldihydropteridine diphosphokinase [Peptococcaceae bacterium]|nr:2-amino-4-hydroxy-6-hydroxymethyldihydropteridine diphosphokinase [Peptococcaceae bacterium]
MSTAYIGLGSNMGDKEGQIKLALSMLDELPGTKVARVASLYRTAPIGDTDQDWFINTVARVETRLGPRRLLRSLLEIEKKLGRVRTRRWGPRVIDLDLLLYDNVRINGPDLIVPHPRLTERAFVVVPLAELAPELVLPGGSTATELARVLAQQQDITNLHHNGSEERAFPDYIDYKILKYLAQLGPEYAFLLSTRIEPDYEETRQRLERLEAEGLIQKVAGRIVKYYHRRRKNVKHRNHTYYELTRKGEHLLRKHRQFVAGITLDIDRPKR